MPTYDASTAECLIFTYKEGLLAAVGHDVKLRAERFSITIEEGHVEANFDAGQVRCVCAVNGREENHGALSQRDKNTIDRYVRNDILHVSRYSKVLFEGDVDPDGDTLSIEGELELHGKARSIETQAARSGGRWLLKVRLHQPDFGIKPFKAMMGALKVKPHVDIELSVPAEAVST